ncbi:putative ATP-dependent RNA helicase DHR1 [Actinomortierella ambigua]|nr:putative ATP-dependent RNA helicase DHR1 [Actinomortierella ambigua]
MGKNRPRYNEKARASSNRSSRPHPNARDGGRPTLKKTILVPKDTNADVVVPGSSDQHEVVTFEAEPQSKMSSKKRKRMEKYIEKKLKKDARGDLYKKIEEQKFSSELLQSSRTLGKSKETKKERLRRALLEERMGIEQSDTSISLYKDKSKADDAYEFDDYDDDDDNDYDDDEGASEDDGDGDVKMKPAPAFNLKPATDSVVYDEGYNPKATSAPLAAVPVKPITASTAAPQGSALKSGTTVLKKAAPKKKMSRLAMIRAQKEKAKEVDSDSSFNSSDSQYDSSSADEDDESDDDGDGKAGEGSNEEDNNEEEPTKKKRRGWVTEDGEEEEERIISNIDSLPKDSGITLPIRNGPQTDLLGNRVQKIKTLDEGEITKAFHVAVNRLPEMQEQRLQLPVCADEQYIMESIRYNDIVIIKGETGSGKTTQVPQFLYEAGYGHADSPNPGMIGITQPRRVAAVSMADRVAKELNLPASKISHQIRYDATTTPGTVMKFMTDGVLLRELNSDFLLRKYSVIIIDEAHERSLNTDILIGALSRIVRLRREESKTDRENTKPLKVIIMSATLAIEEFTRNERLFGFLRDKSQTKEEEEEEESSSPSSESEEEEEEKGEREEGLGSKKPKEVLKLGRANKKVKKVKAKKEKPPKDLVPVVSVDVKKVYGTTMHFNKKTPDYDYITEAFRKVSKIHTRLPEGGILVFLSGQQEITTLVKRLRKKFPFPNPNQPKEGKKDEVTWMTDRTKGKQAGEGQKQDAADSTPENQKVDPRNEDVELEDMAIGEAEVIDDGGDVEVDDEVYELDGSDSEEELLSGDEVLDESPDAGTAPLYVLPLYSLLKTEEQMKVFQPPPEGARICVVATNVAETSITIPNIKYVVDSGKAKERHYDKATGIQTFQVGWTSKASAIQRAGRAGRTSHGHCYRLYSSAVYENEFPNISEAEIHKMPIDGVVLQMKSMHIDNVVNFPFPTPPDRDDLKRAEHRLIYLNALDKAGKKSVTELGKTMSIFPLTPRLAKMLTLAHQENCFPYIIAIVAAMSVGEVFVNEYQLDTSRPGDSDDESEEEEVATRAAMLDDLDEMELQNIRSSKELQRQQKKAMRRKFYKAQSIHEGLDPLNDMAKILNVVGAYARETNKEQFCTENFVRFKAMQEIHQLRGQLTRMVQDNFADLPSVRDLTFDPFMPKPSARQMLAIRQIVACSFVDQVAIRRDLVETVEVNYSKHATQTPYVSMWSKEPLYIHPASGLYGVKPAPDMVVYQDLQKSVQQVPIPGRVPKTYLKGVTVVEPKWMPTLANHTGLVRASKERIIKIDDKTQKAVTDVTFGPKDWPLPPIEIWQRREGARYVPMSKTEIRDKKLDIRRKLNR